MTEQNDILLKINKALSTVLNTETDVNLETDLMAEEILDSLDYAMFLFELEKLCEKKLPDSNMEESGFYKVANIVEYLK